MLGRTRDHGGTAPAVKAEINVTSVVDVAFTLLVVFMITAPILQGGVEVVVPKAPAAPLQTSEGLVISITKDGQLYLDDTPVSMDEFNATVIDVIRQRGSPTVYIKGDTDASYGVVLRVIGRLKEAEIEAVSLIAQPEASRPDR
jgi:biopolymer transport protein ExbD/biopolymer transport protein TolR